MLQEKHFDLIHFGTVTCNTISGQIKLEDGQCWQSETRQKKYEASGLEFKKSQLWITLPNLNTPGGCTVFLQGEELKRMWGRLTFSQSSFHPPSGPNSFCGEYVCRPPKGTQWLQSFPSAQPGSWSSFLSSSSLLLGIVVNFIQQTPQGPFPFCHVLPKKCPFAAPQKEYKTVHLRFSICLCLEVATHRYVGINITASIC